MIGMASALRAQRNWGKAKFIGDKANKKRLAGQFGALNGYH